MITRDGPPGVCLAPVVGTSSLAALCGRWRGRAAMVGDLDASPDELADGFGAR